MANQEPTNMDNQEPTIMANQNKTSVPKCNQENLWNVEISPATGGGGFLARIQERL